MDKTVFLEKYSKLILHIFLGGLLILSLTLPSLYQSIKILMWIPIVISTWLLRKEIKISKSAFIWICVYTITNFVYMIIGYFNGSNDVFKYYTIVHLIAPWVYYFILIHPAQIIRKSFFEKMIRSAFYIINTLIAVSIFLYKFNILPDIIEVGYIGLRIDNYAGYMNYYLPAITSLFFLVPFFSSKVLLSFLNKKIDKCVICDGVILIISFVNSVMIGRRMLMIIFLLSILFVFAFNYLTNRNFSKKLIAVLLSVVLSFVALYIVSNLFGWEIRFTADFFTSGNNERISQIQALLDGWLQSPIFGYGIGINASVIRSEVPGMYEMSYFAMLFQLGIVGFIIKMILFFWVGINLYRVVIICKGDFSAFSFCNSLLIAYISLMIANATNPYLESYDFLLFLMIPLAIVCKYLEVDDESGNLHGDL